MRKYFICHLALMPMRKEPRHTSEMVSQIRFGEILEVYITFELQAGWIHVRTIHDQYDGWVVLQNIKPISEIIFEELKNKKSLDFSNFGAYLSKVKSCTEKVYLPFGTPLNIFQINDVRYQYNGTVLQKRTNPMQDMLFFVKKLLNTPYLWGGRSHFGIDCSGLIQIAYHYATGLHLPRNASQQAEFGQLVKLKKIKKGDLLFFKNDQGGIIHVGIAITKNRLIHASSLMGYVMVSKFDATGIKLTNVAYSHNLAFAKRLV